MTTDIKSEQPAKADTPILVTEFGMVTDVKPLQLTKAPPIILEMFSGIE